MTNKEFDVGGVLGISGPVRANNELGVYGQILTSNGEGVFWGPSVIGNLDPVTSNNKILFSNSGIIEPSNVYYSNTGNVGIGAQNPISKLQVNETDGVRMDSIGSNSYIRLGSSVNGQGTSEILFDRTTGQISISTGNTGSVLTQRVLISNTGTTFYSGFSVNGTFAVNGSFTASNTGVTFNPGGVTGLVVDNTGSVTVNGSSVLAKFTVRSDSGIAGIGLQNPSGSEQLYLWSRVAAGYSALYADNSALNIGTRSAQNLAFVTNNIVRAEVRSDGLLTVNGANPNAIFNIRSVSGTATIGLDTSSGSERLYLWSRISAGVAAVYSDNSILAVGTRDGYDLNFITGNTFRGRFTSGGLFVVNGAQTFGMIAVRSSGDDSSALYIENSTGAQYINFIPRKSSSGSAEIYSNATLRLASSGDLHLFAGGVDRGLISADGTVARLSGVANGTIGSGAMVYVDTSSGQMARTVSSKRYKIHVADYIPKGNFSLLNPVLFRLKDHPNGPIQAGLYAEDLHDLGFPEFVLYNDKGQPDAVHYPNMVALLIYEMKNDKKRIDELEKGLQSLMSRLEALENASGS